MPRKQTSWRWAGSIFALGSIAAISATFDLDGRSGAKEGARLGSRHGTGGFDKGSASPGVLKFTAATETQPVPHAGDAADDPAIWIHRRRPARSTIIATDKDGGLAVYDLSGRQLQFLADGEMNNVDVRSGFPVGARRHALVAASNRTDDTIALYLGDERTRQLTRTNSIDAGIEVYGLCMYRSRRTDRFSVFVDSKEGAIEQWQLAPSGAGVRARLVRKLDVGGTVEGCVTDDGLGRLYVAEEARGIWRYAAEPNAAPQRTLVDSTGSRGHLTADVEGLAIAHGPGSEGWLVASSQGDDSFAIYRRAGGNAFVGKFEVDGGRGIDRVEDTDGIDVTTTALGPSLRHGLFVAQDGDNDPENQNFKLVPWKGDSALGEEPSE